MQTLYSSSYTNRNNFYELYGFDILVDDKLKPWLLEVNIYPSLNMPTPLDKKIKTTLVCDMLNLVGFIPYDVSRQDSPEKTRKITKRKVMSLNDLNYQNCVERLTPEDWNILFEFDEENQRRGNFERIFPTKLNVENYKELFINNRYNNQLIERFLISKKNFLTKIC